MSSQAVARAERDAGRGAPSRAAPPRPRRRAARCPRGARHSSRTVVRANGAASPSAAGSRPAATAAARTSASQSSASAASGAPARYHSTIVNSARWCGPDLPGAPALARSGRCAGGRPPRRRFMWYSGDVISQWPRSPRAARRRGGPPGPGERTRAGVSTSRKPCVLEPAADGAQDAGARLQRLRAPPASGRPLRRGRRARCIRPCACRS